MNKYIINGDFLCRNLTGIERFAYEVTIRLDKIVQKDSIAILIPKNCPSEPSLKNIRIIKSKKNIKSFPKWQQFTFGPYVKKHKATAIDFSNTCSIFAPGIVFIHDIYCKLYPKEFTTFRDKLVKLYSCFMYRFAAKHAKILCTVSQFSKNQISKTYKVNPEKIYVIPNGWEHFKNIESDFSVLKRFSLENKDFYFTLGSLSKRKNLKWISDYAEKHPNELFAISGKSLSGLIPNELKKLQKLSNVKLLGYVTDEEVKALMTKCKAFVFPSYYEGFGIPPLEALSVNAKIIISKSASLPEIYKNSAIYIDPFDSNVNLSDLLKTSTSDSDKILSYYTFNNAAKMILEILKKEF